MFDCVTDCVLTVENGLAGNVQKTGSTDKTDGVKRKQKPRYSIRLEYSAPGTNRLNRTNSVCDEGGFDLKLPPNRFRTRSIAIVAGYSPERVYSNMPPGAFVVESGVYKVGADRDYVKSEPIYWKQVVYGSRAGSDGSGTYPRTGANVQVLHGPRLVANPDLELQGGPSLRASSPLDQGKPLVNWLSPLNNYSDISSVPHPSSAERSFPSTLLTNPLSSISSPNFSLEQSSSRSRGRIGSSLHTIPEDSRLSVTADIHHSGQYSNLSEYTTGETPRSSHISYRSSNLDLGSHPFGEWSLARDISFPGHQIGINYNYLYTSDYLNYNYPAPVHRAISPSTQYPASHIQPPKIPDIRVGQVDPMEFDIYQRIAKLDPENTNSGENIRPLATSSPPGKRKREDESSEDEKNNPRYPAPPDTRITGQSRAGPQAPYQRRVSRSSQRLRDRESRLQTLRELSENETSSKGDDERREYDLVSVVSEGLDAEVTAITSSSSPESSGTNTLQQERASSSSGIASKNTSSSQNQTSSSHSTSGSLSIQQTSLNQSFYLELSKRAILEDKELDSDKMPFYENWPPRPYQFGPSVKLKPPEYITYDIDEVSFSSHPTSGIPPLTPHSGKYYARAGYTVTGSSPNTSSEGPPSRSSRPNSSQSAPLDRSVDRHYEWDSVTTDDSKLAPLPVEWTIRRSPHYNPRRDRDIGPMVQNNRDRVFSDSEIYSNVFPRRRLQIDVDARVRAMKKEFNEYRKTLNSSPLDPDRLESLI